jgi:hypothetical protein
VAVAEELTRVINGGAHMPLAGHAVFTGDRGVTCQNLVMGTTPVMGFSGLDFFASMMQFLSTLGMLGYIVITKRRAELGSANHARRLVLPAYIKILYMFAGASFLAGIAHLLESAVGQTCKGESASGVPAEECCAVELDQMAAAGPGSENEARCIGMKYLNLTRSALGDTPSESCRYDPGGGPINRFFVGLGWQVKAIMVAVDWAVFHVVLEGLALFLMQKGAGARAYRRAVTRSLIWGVFTFVLVFVQEWMRNSPVSGTQCAADLYGEADEGVEGMELNPDIAAEENLDPVTQLQLDAFQASLTLRQSSDLVLLWHGLLLIFYGGLRFAPQQRLSRRPAAIFYASFMLLLRRKYKVHKYTSTLVH